MAEMHQYSIRKSRLKKSYLEGFRAEGDSLVCEPEAVRHTFVSGMLDGAEEGASWGRLRFDCELDPEMVYTVQVLATDDRYFYRKDVMTAYEDFMRSPEETVSVKKSFFEFAGALKAVGQNDLLLYGQKGRYLYILIDVMGKGAGRISGMRIHSQGDIFLDTFPEVYREEESFFHRYLSMFSSLFLDFQDKVEGVDRLFDLDSTPASLLPVFGKWLGLDVSGDFLPEDRLRRLVKEAYQLNRMKGTRAALERLTEIVLGEKAIILEKNVLRENTQAQEQGTYETLYGSGTYDVTMLIKTYVPENQKSQLMFLINQFKPVRSRLLIRFLDEKGNLDEHSYLDMNAAVSEVRAGRLDERQPMDGTVLLQE